MLTINCVSKSYKQKGRLWAKPQQILTSVSFTCKKGECIGIVGESGSGKSTLARLITGLEAPDSGHVTYLGQDIKNCRKGQNISAVFQDYKSSINPFFTVEKAILEAMSNQRISDLDKLKKIKKLLSQVGLPSSYVSKYPHELSGGEAQRVCIARALASEPTFIVFDEAVSALDVSVQVQVLDILKELQKSVLTSFIFITHDLLAATYICDRLIFLKDGIVQEDIAVDELHTIQSDYGKKLLKMVVTI